MTIYCTDCQGELDSAYFDTGCRECSHMPYSHYEADLNDDGYCEGRPGESFGCDCGEWQQKVLRCEQCTHIAANQDSYDNLTPWQQWRR